MRAQSIANSAAAVNMLVEQMVSPQQQHLIKRTINKYKLNKTNYFYIHIKRNRSKEENINERKQNHYIYLISKGKYNKHCNCCANQKKKMEHEKEMKAN